MRYRRLGLARIPAFLLAILLAACAPSTPVALHRPDGSAQQSGCYLFSLDGQLVREGDEITISGHVILWPRNLTGRTAGDEVEIVDSRGRVVFKTGTQTHVSGGFVGDGDAFLACNLEAI